MKYFFLAFCAVLIALDWAGAVISFRAGDYVWGTFSLLIGLFLFSVSIRLINSLPRKPKEDDTEE